MKSPSSWGGGQSGQSSQPAALLPPPVHTAGEEIPPTPMEPCPSTPAVPSGACAFGTTAHSGPFLRSQVLGAKHSWKVPSTTSILLPLHHAPTHNLEFMEEGEHPPCDPVLACGTLWQG